MKKQLLLAVLLLVSSLCLANSCLCDEYAFFCIPKPNSPIADVYQVGTIGNKTAAYWKNGKRFFLQQPTDSISNTSATGLAKSGHDIYVSGFAEYNTGNSKKYKPCYWKNGILNWLSTENNQPKALAIALQYDTTIIVGVAVTNKNTSQVCYWKNNTLGGYLPLPENAKQSGVTSIQVIDGDIYITGFYETDKKIACYWKNYQLQVDLEFEKLSKHIGTLAIDLFKKGDDIYVLGKLEFPMKGDSYIPHITRYCHWKNGILDTIYIGQTQDVVDVIFEKNNLICFGGSSFNEKSRQNLCYWQDGKQYFITNFSSDVYLDDIAVVDKQLFAVGFSDKSGESYFVIRNGKKYSLKIGGDATIHKTFILTH